MVTSEQLFPDYFITTAIICQEYDIIYYLYKSNILFIKITNACGDIYRSLPLDSSRRLSGDVIHDKVNLVRDRRFAYVLSRALERAIRKVDSRLG